ncbi:MAG: ABC transporter permease [Clostridia bacterium]|nr:ABC transporter permease [Clostridia bacterium]
MNYLMIKLRHHRRSPLWWLLCLCPVLIGLFWGAAGRMEMAEGSTYHIGVVDFDETKQSHDFIQMLSEQPSLTVMVYEDKAAAVKGLAGKDVLQAYVVLEGFEDKIEAGDYGELVEVVSMIESPYRDWLNDQVSVSIVRTWLVSDGYNRLKKFNSDYTRGAYEAAFDAYYAENELLIFSVISRDGQVAAEGLEEPPFFTKGFLWSWCFYLFISTLLVTRRFYLERRNHLIKRLSLSGIHLGQYFSEYIVLLLGIALVGGFLSYYAFNVCIVTPDFTWMSLLMATCATGLYMFLMGYGVSRIDLELTQLMFLFSGIFILWCLMATDVMALFPLGGFLRWLSPVALFFQFF